MRGSVTQRSFLLVQVRPPKPEDLTGPTLCLNLRCAACSCTACTGSAQTVWNCNVNVEEAGKQGARDSDPSHTAAPRARVTSKGSKLQMEGSCSPPLPSAMTNSRLSGGSESVTSFDSAAAGSYSFVLRAASLDLHSSSSPVLILVTF